VLYLGATQLKAQAKKEMLQRRASKASEREANQAPIRMHDSKRSICGFVAKPNIKEGVTYQA
jgi:hypothetical protein